MPRHKNSATALLEQQDRTDRATERIDKDPEEALAALEPYVQAAPNVGEVTPQDMFRLMTQMQHQMAGMQEQIITLMSGKGGQSGTKANVDLAAELNADKVQREATLAAWKTEPREPVWIQPDDDEQKIYAVTNGYPPRVFRVNGLEYPVNVGEIVNVPQSIAVLIHHTQTRRPYQKPPQGLEAIPAPQRAQFLASNTSIVGGQQGRTGEGPIIPAHVARSPHDAGPLDVRYDHNGL